MIGPVTIEGIAAGGDGIGHLDDGLAVFVPRSAPGDILTIQVTQRKARYARGRIAAVVSPGPDRVEPRCPHYEGDECGGCRLQHLAAEAQRDAKRRIVGDALRRIAKVDIADPEIVASPHQWRYRGKITLACNGGRIGLHPYDRPVAVFDLTDCLLVRARVMRLWEKVSRNRALLPAAIESLVLRIDRTEGLHVMAIGGDSAWDATPLAAAIGEDDTSFWWKPERGAARVVAGPETGYPAVAFEQMNSAMAAAIRVAAVDCFGDVDGRTAWDLYGGVGDTAEILAARGAKSWSVDVDRSAVEWGRRWRAGSPSTNTSVNRVVDRAEESVTRLPKPDLVVVNPPRAGLGSKLAEWLQRWAAGGTGARLAYISCDPATLARDLSRMPSFAVRKVTAYDLFPQTAHVETMTFLEAA